MADTEADKSGAAAEAGAAEGGASDTENKGGEAAADGEGDAGADAEAGDGKGDDTEDDDDEADDGKDPDTRKKPIDFILARKDAKIAKLAGKGKSGTGDGAGDGKGEGDTEATDDDDIAPEDRDVVIRTITPIIEPLLKQNAAQENEKELSAFLSTNPDFKPFEAKIRRYMEHPTRAGIPVKAIAYEVAGDKLMQIGAKRAKVADEKARQTQTGGGSSREGAGEKSVWDMTPDEFAAEQQKVRAGTK